MNNKELIIKARKSNDIFEQQVDSFAITTCRNCRYFESGHIIGKCHFNKYNTREVEELDFCSNGEAKKTYAQTFLEAFPDAIISEDGVPYVCRDLIFPMKETKCERKDCAGCWREKVKAFEKGDAI